MIEDGLFRGLQWKLTYDFKFTFYAISGEERQY